MLRKITLAFVAAASLSAMALAPTAASAHPWGGKWGGGGWGGFHHHFGHGFGIGFIGGGYGGDGCYVTQTRGDPVRLSPAYGQRLRILNEASFSRSKLRSPQAAGAHLRDRTRLAASQRLVTLRKHELT